MRRAALLVAWGALALATAPWAAAPARQAADGTEAPKAVEAVQGSAALARLIELAETGQDRELVEAGLPQVADDGALARDGLAVALVARGLFATGREPEAFALLERAEPRARDEAGRGAIVLMRARLLLERDELKAALALLTKRPGAYDEPRYPTLPDNLLLLGRGLVRLERHDLAEPLLTRFVEVAPLSPEGPAAWHMLFDCALRRGDLDRARACREQKEKLAQWHELLLARRLQIRRDPTARLPRLGLALLLLEVDELDGAQAALDALIARYPNDRDAWLHLGEVHRRAGRLKEAERVWRRLLQMHPDEQRARYNVAVLLRLGGQLDQARAELERLLASPAGEEERFVSAHLELARVLQAQGLADEARTRYAAYVARGGKEAL